MANKPLNQLSKSGAASDQPAPNPHDKKHLRDHIATVLPLGLLIAFILLIWLLFGERFESAKPVNITTVVTLRQLNDQEVNPNATLPTTYNPYDADPLFQASGWVEADPFPINAITLYSGVVKEVHVLEGESVNEGQLLATLIDEDAQLDYQTAQSHLAQAEAELDKAQAEAEAAEATLKVKQLEIETARARLSELEEDAERLTKSGPDLIAQREITQAQLKVTTQKTHIKTLQASYEHLNATLKVKTAQIQVEQAITQNAATDLARMQLALDRTKIYSPVDGVIQKLYAEPGKKRMLQMDQNDSALIAKIYQPDKLQARIDVPLEEAARLSIGQPVRLRSTLLPNAQFKGKVTRIEGQADIQRNTLQAKVKILTPDSRLRPEMLCRAEFLPLQTSNNSANTPGGATGIALYVPQSALLNPTNTTADIWTIDTSGKHATRKSITLGTQSRDGYQHVTKGLKPGDPIIENPPKDLKEGDKVTLSNTLNQK